MKKQEPTVVNVAPSKEEKREEGKIIWSWIKLFEELHNYAKTTPTADNPSRMKVFYDPDMLPAYKVKIPKADLCNDDLDLYAFFMVGCGPKVDAQEQSGAIEFYFCGEHCEIWSWQNASMDPQQSRVVNAVVVKLLQIEEVASIRTDNGKPLNLEGSANGESVSLNDGLLVLKHWRIATSLQLKQQSPLHSLKESDITVERNILW